ncbi:putative tetratricopeptide repeat protein 41 isoform X1 [Canis lupus familiaris]|uniref:putative tetratricopeptide repeat protein 41 isoform X1 n=1 Tax=Canis lupus familiaris TaxID=9615 RepID=UPI0015F1B02F|nr:putative tetratricopeptide repeat protein 41 isoform X1 [Canis lupus familiaris]
MKMSGSWGDLCSSLLSSPSITDFISKIQNSSFWTRLHLIHYWSMLSEVGYDAAGAYVFTVSKIKADRCHKARRRCSLSVLECRLFEVTTINKCRLMFFIGKFLKLIGKTKEAEGLFLNIENMLAQSQALTQVLPTVQNATREFYLEVGLTHEGFQCFQKAWSNLMEFSPGDIKDNQDVVRQKGSSNTFREHRERLLLFLMECGSESTFQHSRSQNIQYSIKEPNGGPCGRWCVSKKAPYYLGLWGLFLCLLL